MFYIYIIISVKIWVQAYDLFLKSFHLCCVLRSYILYRKCNWWMLYMMISFPESQTNVFLDGDACPASVVNITSASIESVTDVLLDGHMDSCVEVKTLAQNHFRVLVPSSETLHRIRVFSRGITSCSPVNGMTVYGITGCYGKVPCELRMCVVRGQTEQSNGLLCSFTCSGYNHRYALMSISHYARHYEMCEIHLH